MPRGSVNEFKNIVDQPGEIWHHSLLSGRETLLSGRAAQFQVDEPLHDVPQVSVWAGWAPLT